MLAGSLVALIAAAACGSGGNSSTAGDDCTRPLDRREWIQEDGIKGDPSPRQRAADRLIKCRTLIGMSLREARRLLGRPFEGSGTEFAWLLGDERGLIKLDSEYLTVRLRGGRIVRAEVTG